MSRNKYGNCALCNRSTALTFHHLVPKKMHRRNRFRKLHNKKELNTGINVCARCHRGLHRLFDEMTLATRLNSLDALLSDPRVQRHVAWVARQKS